LTYNENDNYELKDLQTSFNVISSVEKFSLITRKSTNLPNLNNGRHSAGLTLIKSDQGICSLFVVGGVGICNNENNLLNNQI